MMPELARAFGSPMILDAESRAGCLRAVAAARGIPLLLYEGGEALRFVADGARRQRQARRYAGAVITDPFRPADEAVVSPLDGIVIGRTNLPLVTEGEGLYHIARLGDPEATAEQILHYRHALDPEEDEQRIV
ncbi:hypothetical protein Atep_14310 [Allochromatium tepidum]|uniref:Uncharacterized protein n=2 Tax=Allochromatium tepidum TaxID=553982 RepID=A0ABN6GAS3_9GAMM|nr:hypothetical protein Atep_14310 [Allochromatium tepidum]